MRFLRFLEFWKIKFCQFFFITNSKVTFKKIPHFKKYPFLDKKYLNYFFNTKVLRLLKIPIHLKYRTDFQAARASCTCIHRWPTGTVHLMNYPLLLKILCMITVNYRGGEGLIQLILLVRLCAFVAPLVLTLSMRNAYSVTYL